MRTRILMWALGSLLIAGGLRAEEEAFLLSAPPPVWQEIIAQLRAGLPVRGAFEEARTTPLRREPLRLSGEMRLAADAGLSLSYLNSFGDPIVVCDAIGVALSVRGKAFKPLPKRPELDGLRLVLGALVGFAEATPEADFAAVGIRTEAGWTLHLQAVDDDATNLRIQGTGGQVGQIDLAMGNGASITLNLRDVETGVTFAAAERAQYFRPEDPR